MKAEKVTVMIEMEALSIDCLRGMINNAVRQIEAEAENGSLVMNDGDTVRWTTTKKPVVF